MAAPGPTETSSQGNDIGGRSVRSGSRSGRRAVRTSGVGLLLVIAMIATACGGSGSGSGSTSTSAGSGPTQAQVAVAAPVAVTLSEFKIDPSTIDVTAGAPVVFNVTNKGQVPHTFAVDVNGTTHDTGQIQPGTSAQLQLPALSAGSYQAYCSIPGHKDLGMKATVVAGASSGAGSSGISGMPGMSSTAPASPSMSAQQMAEMHKAGVDAFLAGHQTTGVGGRLLKPTLDGNVKVFTLTATQLKWEVSKGNFVDAMAFNGQIPGPEIHVSYGDRVRFVVQNQMTQPTVLHFHGMTVPNKYDGVPYITQDPIMPGQYWTYQFTIKDPPGIYVYHSHFNSTEQVGSGLYGAIIIEPPGGHWPYKAASVNPRTGEITYGSTPAIDDEYTIFLGDGPLGFVLNGKSFPATSPMVAKTGDWVLLHLANDGSMLHPMHLHGYHFEVVAQDGFPLPTPYMADTLVVAPGQRYDVLIHAIHPGAWAFHCHILPHVEGPSGMYGMVTALVVK
jgi:manganese oxidase